MTELALYVLNADDRTLIQSANRMLVALGNAGVARRASALGMDEAEVNEGWRLHDAAAGRHRSFQITLTLVGTVSPEQAKAQSERLSRLDAFENTWLPQTRTALPRFVPPADLADVETAFWANLKQQPLGPAVVDSVGLYLARIGEVEASDHPWAPELIASLAKKGLTPRLRADMAAEVAEARALAPALVVPADLVRQVDEANQIQTAALAGLRRWYNDNAQSLRRLPYADRQQVGLLSASERPSGGSANSAPAP